MLLPAVPSTVSYIPPQAPLVNTAMPGSDVARVPYDNVAPTVSNVQIDNNARGNNAYASAASANALAETGGDFELGSPAMRSGSPLGMPTAFLAQLLGQTLSAEMDSVTQSLLVEYEKLVFLSNVKYKPSNAFKPPPAPLSIFDGVLRETRAQASEPEQNTSLPAPNEAQPLTATTPLQRSGRLAATDGNAPSIDTAQADIPSDIPTGGIPASDLPVSDIPVRALSDNSRPPANIGLSAYGATSSRNDAIGSEDTVIDLA
jgi:hypothetical protein